MGNKEGRQIFGTELQNIEYLPYVFTLTAWKVVKTTAHQRLIFKVKKLADALFRPELYIFATIFEIYIVNQPL